jgi:hypothetical protein
MQRFDATHATAFVLAIVLVAAALTPTVLGADDGAEATIDADDDELTMQAGPGQVIAGDATVPAGTELSVRVRSTGGQPVLRTVPTRVDDRGRFRAVVNLTAVPADTPVTVVVRRGDDSLTTVEGTVVQCASACDAGRPVDPADVTALTTSDGRVRLGAAAGRAVVGETSLPPGTDLSVRIRSAGGSSPFVFARTATVGDDGRFRAVYDLSSADPGTPIAVTVVANGTQIASADGEVVACLRRCGSAAQTPTPSPPPLPGVNGTTSTVASPTSGVVPPRLAGLLALAVGGLLGVVGVALLLGLVRP